MPTSAPAQQWVALAGSADGTKLVAGYRRYGASRFYTSSNSAVTWTEIANPPVMHVTSLAASADGTKVVAVGQELPEGGGAYSPGPIYISTNSGATWLQTSAPSNFWFAVASSTDGTKLAAAGGVNVVDVTNWIGLVYTSTNAGATWTLTEVPQSSMHCIASSADGVKLLAAGNYDGAIFTSTNSGTTWTLATNTPSQLCAAVASSADGTRLFAEMINPGTLYISTNSGITWTATSWPSVSWWLSIATSGDGTKLVASARLTGAAGGDYAAFGSTDSGATWSSTVTPPGVGFQSIAMSVDGTQVLAGGFDGIYRLQSGPTLNVTKAGADLLLFWPSYATNFVLQQNMDLTTTNWEVVPSAPAVTNGQDQVVVSPTNRQCLYRLRSF